MKFRPTLMALETRENPAGPLFVDPITNLPLPQNQQPTVYPYGAGDPTYTPPNSDPNFVGPPAPAPWTDPNFVGPPPPWWLPSVPTRIDMIPPGG